VPGVVGWAGRVMTMVVPPPGVSSRAMVPWWRAIIRWQVDRPMPWPFRDSGSIWANISKTRSRWAGGIPRPLSAMRISQSGPAGETAIEIAHGRPGHRYLTALSI
jgi:hypothetical protein